MSEYVEETITLLWDAYLVKGYVDKEDKHEAFSHLMNRLDELVHGEDNIPKLFQ